MGNGPERCFFRIPQVCLSHGAAGIKRIFTHSLIHSFVQHVPTPCGAVLGTGDTMRERRSPCCHKAHREVQISGILEFLITEENLAIIISYNSLAVCVTNFSEKFMKLRNAVLTNPPTHICTHMHTHIHARIHAHTILHTISQVYGPSEDQLVDSRLKISCYPAPLLASCVTPSLTSQERVGRCR